MLVASRYLMPIVVRIDIELAKRKMSVGDDSPGGQLIGVLLIVGAVVLGVRMVRRNR